MNELHTVFDITVGPNGIGDDAWFRMAIGIGAAIAGMVWLVRAWRMQAGWRQMFNAVSLIGFGAIWLIVTLPLWNLATSDTDRLLPLASRYAEVCASVTSSAFSSRIRSSS
ncbi:MAG: hypothetical protein E6H79_18210 [Betaproteobacteria bacterium]|nr:MAG: hypothetical protein E6H79_18210 [Betaproteobacteria bacterium]